MKQSTLETVTISVKEYEAYLALMESAEALLTHIEAIPALDVPYSAHKLLGELEDANRRSANAHANFYKFFSSSRGKS